MISKYQLEKSFIKFDASILDALKAINASGSQLALIIDDKVLKGVISDGDIRRSFLKGYKLNDKISDIFNKNSTKITENQLGEEAREIMINNGLNALPVIDDNGRAIDIFSFSICKINKNQKSPSYYGGRNWLKITSLYKNMSKANVTLTWRQTHP